MQNSLFEPSPDYRIASATDLVLGVMFGEVALGLLTLAVAGVGALMLTGRMPVGWALRSVVGGFVLLGAPVIASGFIDRLGSGGERVIAPPVLESENGAPTRELPPADHDPYSGA
ncbi:MAG: TrbC/VirB2 family protein [Pseudomonadota bacterium]